MIQTISANEVTTFDTIMWHGTQRVRRIEWSSNNQAYIFHTTNGSGYEMAVAYGEYELVPCVARVLQELDNPTHPEEHIMTTTATCSNADHADEISEYGACDACGEWADGLGANYRATITVDGAIASRWTGRNRTQLLSDLHEDLQHFDAMALVIQSYPTGMTRIDVHAGSIFDAPIATGTVVKISA